MFMQVAFGMLAEPLSGAAATGCRVGEGQGAGAKPGRRATIGTSQVVALQPRVVLASLSLTEQKGTT
jgi:hypothetical protein